MKYPSIKHLKITKGEALPMKQILAALAHADSTMANTCMRPVNHRKSHHKRRSMTPLTLTTSLPFLRQTVVHRTHTLEVVPRNKIRRGFAALPKRWIVEQTRLDNRVK